MKNLFSHFSDFIKSLTVHWLSYLGVTLVSLSVTIFILALLFVNLFLNHVNPYLDLIVLLILPGFFFIGLIFIPIGIYIKRKKIKEGKDQTYHFSINFSNPTHRIRVFLFVILTVVNVFIFGLAAYQGMSFMDSVHFCGQLCHSVMTPEFSTYKDSPHSRIKCVQCHIGPGASWFVKSKLSGLRQVFAVTFNTYSKPIPQPVHELRPARDTCEKCHWPQKFHGEKFKIIEKFSPDAANTPSYTALIIKIGMSVMM